MALPRLLIHHLATFLHQEMQQAGFYRVRLQGPQPFAMAQQQIQQGFGVARVALGSRRRKGLPVTRRSGRMDREQHQVGYLLSIYTSAPRDCSTITAIGRPPNRCCRATAQASTASGVFSNSPASDPREPAGRSRQKFFWSAQSIAANAAHSGSDAAVVHPSDMLLNLPLERAGLGSCESLIESLGADVF